MSKSNTQKRRSRFFDRLFHRGSRPESFEGLLADGFFFRPSDTLNAPRGTGPLGYTSVTRKSTLVDSLNAPPQAEAATVNISRHSKSAFQPMRVGAPLTSSPSTTAIAPKHQLQRYRANTAKPEASSSTIHRRPPRPAKSQPMLRDQYSLQHFTAHNFSSIDLGVVSDAGASSKMRRTRKGSQLAQVESVQCVVSEPMVETSMEVERDDESADTGMVECGADEEIEDWYHDSAEVGLARYVRGVTGKSRQGGALKRVLVKKNKVHIG